MPKPGKIELHIVRLTADQAARVDAWAAALAIDPADAIPRLVELGLARERAIGPASHHRCGGLAIEAEAVTQIGLLIDPETPEEERERRIQRLTEGPPEFVDFRLDLPGRRPN
jgi:hypothetical protein